MNEKTAGSDMAREEKIERIGNALWNISDDKLNLIAAVIDL